MRIREVVREAWRNLVSGTTRALIWACAVVALAGTLAWLDMTSARAIVVDAYRYREAGASTLVLEAPGAIVGSACDALAAVPTVRASGAVRAGGRHIVPALPQQPVSGSAITPGFAQVLGVDVRDAGVVIPTELAARIGGVPGGTIVLDDATVPVTGVYRYPDDGRRPGFGYLVLSPVPAEDVFDECWLDAWPQTSELRGLLVTTIDGHDDRANPPRVAQLNTTLGASFDGPARFAARATWWVPWACLAGGLGLGFASVRLRRLELASAQHAGMARPAQLIQLLVEAAVWAAMAMGLTVPILVLAATGLPPEDALPLALLGLLAPLGTATGALAGVSIGAALTREEALFAYFKGR